eukprot:768033-Hanusia_phi.AAC.5
MQVHFVKLGYAQQAGVEHHVVVIEVVVSLRLIQHVVPCELVGEFEDKPIEVLEHLSHSLHLHLPSIRSIPLPPRPYLHVRECSKPDPGVKDTSYLGEPLEKRVETLEDCVGVYLDIS